ncbi:c-type heme family protein [Desulfolithobacter sp.]
MEQNDTLSSGIRSSSIGLQSRFMLGLACIFICFCIVVTSLLYLHEKKQLEEDIYQKTELIMAAVESTRGYVREVLRPKMYEVLGDETFVLEAMSTSYIGRVVMDRFQDKVPLFEYRRAAINARNPKFEADDLELEKIKYFAEHPEKDDWHGIVKSEGQHMYMRFRPVRFTPSCLRCHGDPEDAPQAVIDLYGNERGFMRRPDVVRGVVSVGVPVDAGLMPIMEMAWKVFCTTFVSVIFLYGIVWFFFNKLIIRDLRGLLEIFRDNLRDEHGVQLYEQARTKDEFGELAASVQAVARHLRTTRHQLEDYAKNLEKKVEERTLALRRSEQSLREKVITRGQELRTLNTISELITQSVHLADILPRVLQQALKVIPAEGAGIYLLDRQRARLVLQCREQAEMLDETIPFDPLVCLPFLDEKMLDFDRFIQEAACSRLGMTGEEAVLANNFNVPLCCRSQVLGVMTFVGRNLEDVDIQLQELLFSIGHQIGITIESLQNISRLIESKELLQSVFDGITDVVLLLDAEYRIKMVNKAFLDQHGLRLEDILNRSLAELPLKNPCPFTVCRTPLAELPRTPVVEQIDGQDGHIYEVNFYPLFSDRGEVRNVVCYAKDITEKKQVEQRIQQTEKLVSLGQLAAGVAHEINNPLGIILCYTDNLLEDHGDLDPPVLEDIRVIEKHARSCQRIVTDLLNFSRSQKTVKRRGSINQAIEDVVALVRQQFLKQRIRLTLHLGEELPDVLLDLDKVKQVFLNLLMNAAHAIDGEGIILVTSRYEAENNRLVVLVEDNGRGIDREVADKIFDPFFTTKSQSGGTGLGLSVSYGIVRDHDGDIRVESKPGRWTRFIITLPV